MRRLALGLISCLLCSVVTQARAQYLTPTDNAIAEVITAAPLPDAYANHDGSAIIIAHFSIPTIASLSAPHIQLARYGRNTLTRGPWRVAEFGNFELLDTTTGVRQRIDAPEGAFGPPLWSPNGTRFLISREGDDKVELWVGSVQSDRLQLLATPGVLQARFGAGLSPPCSWFSDSTRAVCQFLPEAPRDPPDARAFDQPEVLVADGSSLSLRIYSSAIRSPFDSANFDFYLTSEVRTLNVASNELSPPLLRGRIERLSLSPNDRYLLVSTIERPYSPLLQAYRFPKRVQVLDLSTNRSVVIANIPANTNGDSVGGRAPPGPRHFAWRPGRPAELTFVETLDGGDPSRVAAYRERLVRLTAPFRGSRVDMLRTRGRLLSTLGADEASVWWTPTGRAIAAESDGSVGRLWLVDPESHRRPVLLASGGTEEIAERFGSPMLDQGVRVLSQNGSLVFFRSHEAACSSEQCPALSALDLQTGVVAPYANSPRGAYAWAMFGEHSSQLLLIEGEPAPRLVLRRASRADIMLAELPQPPAPVARVQWRRVSYARADGLPLGGILYLPDGRANDPLPLIIYGYPSSHENAAAARASLPEAPPAPWTTTGTSFVSNQLITRLMAAQGYAVLDAASFPVVGNQRHVDQLVDDASAAIDYLSGCGVVDPRRVAIVGQSAGGTLAALLLAHSDLFATGVSVQGPFNFTTTVSSPAPLTTRSLWRDREVALALSPILDADKINEPILIIHGAADDNFASTLAGARQMFDAMNAVGGRARFVALPHEHHSPTLARESRLHVAAELENWFAAHLRPTSRPSAPDSASATCPELGFSN